MGPVTWTIAVAWYWRRADSQITRHIPCSLRGRPLVLANTRRLQRLCCTAISNGLIRISDAASDTPLPFMNNGGLLRLAFSTLPYGWVGSGPKKLLPCGGVMSALSPPIRATAPIFPEGWESSFSGSPPLPNLTAPELQILLSPTPVAPASASAGGGPNYALSNLRGPRLLPPILCSPLAPTVTGRHSFFVPKSYIRPSSPNNCKEMDSSSRSPMIIRFRPNSGASIRIAAAPVHMRNVGALSPKPLMRKSMNTAVGENAALVNLLMYCIANGRSVIVY